MILLSSMQRLWYIGKDTVDLEESQDILFNICREGFALKVRFLFCVITTAFVLVQLPEKYRFLFYSMLLEIQKRLRRRKLWGSWTVTQCTTVEEPRKVSARYKPIQPLSTAPSFQGGAGRGGSQDKDGRYSLDSTSVHHRTTFVPRLHLDCLIRLIMFFC